MIRIILSSIFVTIFVFLIGCNTKDEYDEYPFKDLINSVVTYSLSDSTSSLTMLNDIKIYKDSLAIITDFYSQAIYKYDFSQNRINKLGTIGKGPGEYLNAFGLFIKDNRIYYSDANEPGIESFDLNGSNPKRVDNVYLSTYSPKIFFVDSDNTFFYLKELAREGYFVISSKGQKYGKTLKIFSENRLNRYPFAGAYFNNNKIYFMYMVESKIYSINTGNNTEENPKINVEGFFNWDMVKNEKMNQEMDNNTRELYSRVGKFLGFQFNGKTYFFISIYNKRLGNKHIVCNEKGKILFSIKDFDEYELEHVTDNNGYIYPLNKNELQLISFRWNDKFKNLLNKSE